MKKRPKKGLGGESNSSGFKIELCKIVGSETTSLVEAKSRNYNPGAPWKKPMSKKIKIIRFISLFFLALAVLVSSHFLFTGELIVTLENGDLFFRIYFNSCIYFFLLLISFVIVMSVKDAMDLCGLTKQWHACEHKLGNLFEQKLEISLENLRKMSRAHWRCGHAVSVYQNSIITFLFVGSYLVLGYWAGLGLLPGLALTGTVIGILVVILNLIAYIFVTAKPTEEQLEETLRVAKEFKAKLEKQNF